MISIITPVYNAEKYLPRCLDSILAQTYEDWELLLINDGSTDGSGRICEEYASRDARIRLYDKENGGVASARQLGIEQARGEYSIHVDPDDWVESQMLEVMLEEAIKIQADIVVADFYKEKNGKVVLHQQRSKDNTPSSLIRDIVKFKQMGSLCNKLIRHSLYKKYKVFFEKNLNLCEDELVLVKLLIYPLSITYLKSAYYHYMDNGESTLSHGYDRIKYMGYNQYYGVLLKEIPMGFRDIVRLNIQKNHLYALSVDIVTPKELRSQNIKFPLSFIFAKNIGNKGRLSAFLYIIGFDYLHK